MATERVDGETSAAPPDLTGLSEEERNHVMLVLQRAKEFEDQEEKYHISPEQQRTMMQPLEGQLLKYTNVMKGWQYRYFVLDPDHGRLEYYERAELKRVQKPRSSVQLAGAVISPSDEDSQTFTLNAANSEIYKLRASDARERQHWVNRLRATAEYHTGNLTQYAPPLPKDNRPSTFGSQHSLQSSRQFDDSLENLSQDANFTQKSSAHASPKFHGSRLKKRNQTKAPPSSMPSQVTDSFKKVREKLTQVQTQEHNLVSKIEQLPPSGEYINALDKEMLLLKATSSATLACLEQCLSILQQQQQTGAPSHPPTIIQDGPTIEWLEPSSIPMSSGGRHSIISPVSPADSFVSATDIAIDHRRPDVKIEHEEEIEDEHEYSDTDLGAVDEHKSVILHLLSNLKLGMDLTKVVLPTFILEKRSLLEMFADCMAHPGYFLKIPELEDPEARMLAVVEWYLTSFHAGRKGTVAKKPYNPIIGETFHCSWTLPKNSSSTKLPPHGGPTQPNGATSSDLQNGVAGKAETDKTWLYYTAEQVSHHPPISAFYFECPEKQMSMNASIWTKSKFMGMSIGVVMVGKVCLNLLSHGEDYVFSLPSAYARSILTVPWIELGDRVTVVCQKTGYSASVIFHTKPFYGGKLHRITSEVKNPAGEIICRINGEWNGVLEFAHANGVTRTIDTAHMKIDRKQVRPLDQQGDFESRKLWRNVTQSLQKNDINMATKHKEFLEERQRQEERHRKAANAAFPTKYFHEVSDGHWLYNTPLKPGQTTPSL